MNQPHILDFDIGNSRIKWRYSSADAVIATGAFGHEDDQLHELPVDADSLGRVRIASVAGEGVLSALRDRCRTQWQVEPEIARVVDHCAGVRQGYVDKSRLGVDRWLALLAAHQTAHQGCVLVSCGTAITVDLLTANGEHLGGYIVPGLELLRRSLFAGTRAVKLEKVEPPDSLAPARDTVPAVNRGLVLMVKGLVDNAMLELRKQSNKPGIIVTGGDGQDILPFLIEPFSSTKGVYNPSLVLDGLALALP